MTDDYCTGFETLSEGRSGSTSEPVPLRYVTNQFATILVDRAAAEQLADEYDVEPSSAYKSGLAQLEPELETLSEDQKDAFLEILGADNYNQDVLTQIGEISLQDQGTTDATDGRPVRRGAEGALRPGSPTTTSRSTPSTPSTSTPPARSTPTCPTRSDRPPRTG